MTGERVMHSHLGPNEIRLRESTPSVYSVVNIPGRVEDNTYGLVLDHLKLPHECRPSVLQDRSSIRHSQTNFRFI